MYLRSPEETWNISLLRVGFYDEAMLFKGFFEEKKEDKNIR